MITDESKQFRHFLDCLVDAKTFNLLNVPDAPAWTDGGAAVDGIAALDIADSITLAV